MRDATALCRFDSYLVTRGHAAAQAFLAASLKTDAELLKWFRDRLVWNEPETVVDLLKNGLFVRLYEPQVRISGYACCPLPLLCMSVGQSAAQRQLVRWKMVRCTHAVPWEKLQGSAVFTCTIVGHSAGIPGAACRCPWRPLQLYWGVE